MAIGLLLALAGCQSVPNLGAACARASECSGGLVCRFGRCRAECTRNDDCPAGSTCFLASDGAGACSIDVDLSCSGGTGTSCASGLTCLGGQCVRTCETAADCPADGECRAVPGTAISFCFDARVPAPDAGPAPEDAGDDAAQTSPDGGDDAGLDASGDGGDAGFSPPPMPAAHVCSGGGFLCSIEGPSEEVHCWGDAKWGTLGTGTADCTLLTGASDYDITARTVQTVGGPLVGADGVACGAEFACAHLRSGEVWCWGRNDARQLGQPPAALCSSYAMPVPFTGPDVPGADARILATSRQACLFEPSRGKLWCWGRDAGVLGTFADDDTPRLFTPPGASAPLAWLALGHGSASGDFACGITIHGDPHCWGDGSLGQTMSAGPTPTLLRAIGAGREHGVAIHHTSITASWGSDRHGALLEPPDGSLLDCGVPCSPRALDAPAHFTGIATQGDASFTCTITGADSHVECWGENRALQAGVPDPTDAGVASIGHPVLDVGGVVLADAAAGSLIVGFENACVRLSSTSALYCWGANDRGQLQQDPMLGAPAVSDAAILMHP
ncbi:MAG: hypothetical protein U0234_12590 [Sandaracinus sp.]